MLVAALPSALLVILFLSRLLAPIRLYHLWFLPTHDFPPFPFMPDTLYDTSY